MLVLSLLAIFGMPPSFLQKGVKISFVDQNSSLYEQGMRQGQILHTINDQSIKSIDDYTNFIFEKFPLDENEKIIFKTNAGEYIVFTNQAPDLIVEAIPKTHIKLGLDLSGGSRALVKAENKITEQQAIIKKRKDEIAELREEKKRF